MKFRAVAIRFLTVFMFAVTRVKINFHSHVAFSGIS